MTGVQTCALPISNSFLFLFADPSETVRRLMRLEFEGLPADYYQTLLDRYRAITPERLHEVAIRYLRPQDFAIVVVGDAKVLETPLAQFGPVKKIPAEPPTDPAP